MSTVTALIQGPRRRAVLAHTGLPRAWSSGAFRCGTIIAALLISLAIIGVLLLENPNTQDLAAANEPPGSSGHLLGTDPLGRDVLAWTLGGIRTSLVVGLGVVVLAGVVGVLVGMVAGYFGGVTDTVLMRFVDLQLAIPPLLLFIAASAVIATTVTNLILLIAVVGWVPYARTVRARVFSERARASIGAARLAGASHVRIMLVHLLPSVASIVLVVASLQVGYVLIWESGLSFLSLGVQPPSTSLGFMIAQARDSLLDSWWVAMVPGVALCGLVIAANLIGDGLRDAFGLSSAEMPQ